MFSSGNQYLQPPCVLSVCQLAVYTFTYIEKFCGWDLDYHLESCFYLCLGLVPRQDTLNPFYCKFERTKICYERKGASDSIPVKVMFILHVDDKFNLHLLQIFFLSGRLIFGPDARSLLVTLLLLIAPVVIFCVFVARHLRHHFSSYNAGYAIIVAAIVFTIHVSS